MTPIKHPSKTSSGYLRNTPRPTKTEDKMNNNIATDTGIANRENDLKVKRDEELLVEGGMRGDICAV